MLILSIYRKDSIANTYTLEHAKDKEAAISERWRDFINYGYSNDEYRLSMYSAAIGFLARTLPAQNELYITAREIVDSIKGIPKVFNNKKKVALITWRINKRLFYLLSKITGRLEK